MLWLITHTQTNFGPIKQIFLENIINDEDIQKPKPFLRLIKHRLTSGSICLLGAIIKDLIGVHPHVQYTHVSLYSLALVRTQDPPGNKKAFSWQNTYLLNIKFNREALRLTQQTNWHEIDQN